MSELEKLYKTQADLEISLSRTKELIKEELRAAKPNSLSIGELKSENAKLRRLLSVALKETINFRQLGENLNVSASRASELYYKEVRKISRNKTDDDWGAL